MTIEELRQIAERHGVSHAEFCVEQEVSQVGRAACEPLYEELTRMEIERLDEMNRDYHEWRNRE